MADWKVEEERGVMPKLFDATLKPSGDLLD